MVVLFSSVFNVVSAQVQTTGMMRGVVYDCGLMFGGKNLSMEVFDERQVGYDMDVIAHILMCNTVRVEGEDLSRLRTATLLAHKAGLRVFFNPWKHEATAEETIRYMSAAAKVAEELRRQGVDLVFVAGCEYTLFSKGAFPGDTFDERIGWLTNLGKASKSPEEAMNKLNEASGRLNKILADICKAVRQEFKGKVMYSSGTWEQVDWSLFDLVGVDYYRNGETADAYVHGLDRYRPLGKPIVCMEVGCCTYEGAAPRGGFGFSILQGVDAEGNGIYEGGVMPKRSEKEQADYVEDQVTLLHEAGIDGVFVYVFRYPIYPYREKGCDKDMTSYSLVKSFAEDDARSRQFPSWQPKEAFFRLGKVFSQIESRERLSIER